MSRLASALPLRSDANKEVSDTFRSLKKSLKDTLERLETIGINDFEPPDEIVNLKSQLAQKDKIIAEQSQVIEKLSSQVSMLSTNNKALTEVPIELSRLISNCLFKIQDFHEFAEKCKLSHSDLINLIRTKRTDQALVSVLETFNEFMDQSKNKPPRNFSESLEYRGINSAYRQSPMSSKYSDIDQEINDQKKIFSNLCKEIALSLNPDLNELESDLDEN